MPTNLSGRIEDAQLHINNRTTSANDSCRGNTANGLHGTLGEFKDVEQQQQPIVKYTAEARQDAPNEFSARDTKQSRSQRSRNSTKPVSKAISTGEDETARQQAELNMIDAELRRSIQELFGKQDFEQALFHNSNQGGPQKDTEMRPGTEKTSRDSKDSLVRTSQSTLKESEGVDEVLSIYKSDFEHSLTIHVGIWN